MSFSPRANNPSPSWSWMECLFSPLIITNTWILVQIWLDRNLYFKRHIDFLAKKLKFTLGFLYRLKSCLSMASRKHLVAAQFLLQIDQGDTIYGFVHAWPPVFTQLWDMSLTLPSGHIIVYYSASWNGHPFLSTNINTDTIKSIRLV